MGLTRLARGGLFQRFGRLRHRGLYCPARTQLRFIRPELLVGYLPRKLSDDGSARFESEAVSDLCYYASWGNLAMLHGPYR